MIVPLRISLALKMIPEPVLAEYREKAAELRKNGKSKKRTAGALVFQRINYVLTNVSLRKRNESRAGVLIPGNRSPKMAESERACSAAKRQGTQPANYNMEALKWTIFPQQRAHPEC